MRQLGFKNVIGVNFGAGSPVSAAANMRAYIWYQMREWLKLGAIGKDQNLEIELTGPGYQHNAQTSIVLESKESMKKRGISSPNHGDALACTFASQVLVSRPSKPYARRDREIMRLRSGCSTAWMA